MADTVYEFEAHILGGGTESLAKYEGKGLLIVNVASLCGFTPQYHDLQALYDKYRDRGLEILGFPCNQFGGQEPGSAAEIRTFCSTTYAVTFPLYEKVDVNGPNAHPLYKFLTSAKPGSLGTEPIEWNFTKFLIDRKGNLVRRFAPSAGGDALAPQIEQVLG